MATNGSPEAETTTTSSKALPRWRRILVVVLLVLGVILAPLSVFAVWTHNTLLSTDQYVDTVGPLADDPVVTDRIATRAVDALFANVDVDAKITDALPEKASALAPAITKAVEGLALDVAKRFMASDQFATLWRDLNRRAHSRVVNVLTGTGGHVTKGGKVVVELGPVVQKVRAKLEDLGVDVFAGTSASQGGAKNEFVLFQSDDLEAVQGGIDLLQSLAIVLPILTVLLLAAAVALAGDRRKTLLRAALGVAFMMALLLIGFNVLRSVFVDAFRPEGRAAGGAVYDQLLEFLRLSVRALFALGIIVAIGAWLAGPGRYATRIREWFQGVIGKGVPAGTEASGVSVAVANHRTPLRVVVVGLGAVLLMALSRPSGVTVLVVALLVLLGLLVIEVLARGARAASANTS